MTRVVVPPIKLSLDGAEVFILEVTENTWVDGSKHYLVTFFIKWRNLRSQVATIDVRDNQELIQKLRAEIAKFKLLIYGGMSNIFQRV
ncbi:MAG: hypothetical protein DRI26_03455 [Chloroflexi bacterium]|nr:MAG: hypothetical protein DRI26_03455 [Chloroflexota bacterium]